MQLDDTKKDERLIPRMLGNDMNVVNVLLAQSKYINTKGFLRTKSNKDNFPFRISWEEMNKLYPNDILDRADNLE